jgi:hypothetical protein
MYGHPIDPGHAVADWIHGLLPYSEGGRCAPRWYDIAVDLMYLNREEVGSNVGFTANARFAGPPNTPSIVLSTDNLEYEEEVGFRFNAAVISGPGSNVEFTYFGLFNWASTASVSSATNSLFSIYTNYGFPVVRDEVDNTFFQSVGVSSTLDNFEVNFRRRWVGPNCFMQGSWLAGARYIYLLDDLDYRTFGTLGRSETQVRALNSLTGFQVGGDLWFTLVPGISVGGDVKAGVYGNYGKQNTRIFASLTPPAVSPPAVFEESSNNDVAMVGEANVSFIWRLNPNWTLRAGYTFLYLEGVALATDNFNPANPFNTNRAVRELDDNSDLNFHGGFVGVEWMW